MNFCTGDAEVPVPSQLGNTFLGTGNDEAGVSYTNAAANFKGGFYLKDDFMALQVDIVNYNKTPQKIYITFDIEYLSGKTGTDAASVLLSLTGCRSPAFMLVDKEVSMESDAFRIFENGAIINASKFCEIEVRAVLLSFVFRGPFACKYNPSTGLYSRTRVTYISNRTEASSWNYT